MIETVVTLRDIRKAKGLTIEDVITNGGPKISAYSKIDCGVAKTENITLETFLKICRAFDMSPNDLIKQLGIDWKKV